MVAASSGGSLDSFISVPRVPLVECSLRAVLVFCEGAMGSAWSFRRELPLSVTIPVLWGGAIRLLTGHRHWVKVLSPA